MKSQNNLANPLIKLLGVKLKYETSPDDTYTNLKINIDDNPIFVITD